jgi:hypothetical protein
LLAYASGSSAAVSEAVDDSAHTNDDGDIAHTPFSTSMVNWFRLGSSHNKCCHYSLHFCKEKELKSFERSRSTEVPMTEHKRRWFQIHLSTLLCWCIMAGMLLGLNYWVINDEVGRAVWEFGLPVFGWSRHRVYDGQLALKLPCHAYINIALNIGFSVMVAAIWESFVRRREARTP